MQSSKKKNEELESLKLIEIARTLALVLIADKLGVDSICVTMLYLMIGIGLIFGFIERSFDHVS